MSNTIRIDPRQNLKNAQKQLKSLSRADQKFAGGHAYDLRKSTVTEDGDTYGIIYVDSHKPMPEIIPRLAEDVCNNLLSALDEISRRLLLRVNSNFNHPTCFPICDTPEKFANADLKSVGGLPQDQQYVFENVQPYNRGNNYLCILQALAGVDNRRPMTIFSTTSIIDHIKLRGMISPSGKFRLIVDQSKTVELKTGAELLRVSLEEMVGDIDLDRNFKYWQVFGHSSGIAEGLPVISTLSAISKEVKWVLDQFRPFLGR